MKMLITSGLLILVTKIHMIARTVKKFVSNEYKVTTNTRRILSKGHEIRDHTKNYREIIVLLHRKQKINKYTK